MFSPYCTLYRVFILSRAVVKPALPASIEKIFIPSRSHLLDEYYMSLLLQRLSTQRMRCAVGHSPPCGESAYPWPSAHHRSRKAQKMLGTASGEKSASQPTPHHHIRHIAAFALRIGIHVFLCRPNGNLLHSPGDIWSWGWGFCVDHVWPSQNYHHRPSHGRLDSCNSVQSIWSSKSCRRGSHSHVPGHPLPRTGKWHTGDLMLPLDPTTSHHGQPLAQLRSTAPRCYLTSSAARLWVAFLNQNCGFTLSNSWGPPFKLHVGVFGWVYDRLCSKASHQPVLLGFQGQHSANHHSPSESRYAPKHVRQWH